MEFTTKGKILLPYFLHHGKEAAIVEAKDLKGRLDLGIHVTLTLQEYICLFFLFVFLCVFYVFILFLWTRSPYLFIFVVFLLFLYNMCLTLNKAGMTWEQSDAFHHHEQK